MQSKDPQSSKPAVTNLTLLQVSHKTFPSFSSSMRTKAASPLLTSTPSLYKGKATYSPNTFHHSHGDVIEEIQGLIRVYRDGHVERPQIVPYVPASPSPDPNNVTSMDIPIHTFTNTWARLYVPTTTTTTTDTSINFHQNQNQNQITHKLPLLIYFHGGGFCVGSASWSCYHHFLSKLSSNLTCLILSLNYRLAPEHPLPAAYQDGIRSLAWVTHQARARTRAHHWWTSKCDFSRVFLAGDSAGGNIAYHVAVAAAASTATVDVVKGVILLQPFFGGEKRTASESESESGDEWPVKSSSGLSVGASDAYWRMALPGGASRDHEWCNPVEAVVRETARMRVVGGVLVCVAEKDILRDRNVEVCEALARAGVKVEYHVCKGVGHAFHVLSKSEVSQIQTRQMMARIKAFVMAL